LSRGARNRYDGGFKRSETDLSQFTLMIYLNSGFDGGEMHFYDADLQLRATVRPETGMAWYSGTLSCTKAHPSSPDGSMC